MFHHIKNTLIATVLLPLAFGCKREKPNQLGTNTTTTTPETSKVQQWLKGNPKALTGQKVGQKVGSTLPNFTLQWKDAKFDATARTHYVPAIFTNTKAAGSKSNTYLVATENEQGHVTGGQYVMVLPNAKKMGKGLAGFDPVALLGTENPKGFSGALLYYDVRGQLTGSQVYEAGQLQPKATANLAARDDAEDDPDPNYVVQECGNLTGTSPCIEWYWQTYVNGVLIAEDYMFTTCCGGSCGGGGTGVANSPAITSCDRTQAQAQSIIQGISLENTDDVMTINGQPYGGTKANDPIRMPKQIRWGFAKLHLYWGYYLRYTMVFSGVVYRNNSQDNVWKWESVNSGDLQRTGEMAPCVNVQFTHSLVTPIISADKRKFSTGITYTAIATAPCLIGAEVGTFNGGHPYVSFDASRNESLE